MNSLIITLPNTELEVCLSCNKNFESYEMFCSNCGNACSLIKEIGEISPQYVFGSNYVKGFPKTVPALSHQGVSITKTDNFDQGLFSVRDMGIAFFFKENRNRKAKKIVEDIALFVVGLKLAFPLINWVAWGIEKGIEKAREKSKEKKLAELLTHPSSYIIPFNEICNIEIQSVKGSGFLSKKKLFLIISKRNGNEKKRLYYFC